MIPILHKELGRKVEMPKNMTLKVSQPGKDLNKSEPPAHDSTKPVFRLVNWHQPYEDQQTIHPILFH